jgi:hypothetical protein
MTCKKLSESHPRFALNRCVSAVGWLGYLWEMKGLRRKQHQSDSSLGSTVVGSVHQSPPDDVSQILPFILNHANRIAVCSTTTCCREKATDVFHKDVTRL